MLDVRCSDLASVNIEHSTSNVQHRTNPHPCPLPEYRKREKSSRASHTLTNQLAILHVELVGENRGELGAVGDGDDHGVVGGGQVEDELADGGAGFGVEVAGGFVAEEEGGFVHEGAGDGDALALAAGELAGEVRGAVGEADFGEEIFAVVF